MRGEKMHWRRGMIGRQGSPPHARGKERLYGTWQSGGGITPACAGKSAMVLSSISDMRDHPRMRGEKVRYHATPDMNPGSPPHARGKVWRRLDGDGFSGITPACAGKSLLHSRYLLPCRDHPRMRGEKYHPVKCADVGTGSPPHARGKEHLHFSSNVPLGITPACAGKSLLSLRQRVNRWDHPRMRGEKSDTSHSRIANSGSPPHARGKEHQEQGQRRERGITPACAGKRHSRLPVPR